LFVGLTLALVGLCTFLTSGLRNLLQGEEQFAAALMAGTPKETDDCRVLLWPSEAAAKEATDDVSAVQELIKRKVTVVSRDRNPAVARELLEQRSDFYDPATIVPLQRFFGANHVLFLTRESRRVFGREFLEEWILELVSLETREVVFKVSGSRVLAGADFQELGVAAWDPFSSFSLPPPRVHVVATVLARRERHTTREHNTF